MRKKIVASIIAIILMSNFLIPTKSAFSGPQTASLNEREEKAFLSKLFNASTIDEQFNLLKEYGMIPKNSTLPSGPYRFSMIFAGLAFPPIPYTWALIAYGHIFHLMPLALIFLNLIFRVINFLTPPLPEISAGYLFGGEGDYKFMVKTPTYNFTHEAIDYIGVIYLISQGFIGWKIYIPLHIFTGVAVVIYGIPIPIPFAVTVLIGASPYLKYLCY